MTSTRPTAPWQLICTAGRAILLDGVSSSTKCCSGFADWKLQEELEAYDKHQRLLEDQLDGKTAELIGEV